MKCMTSQNIDFNSLKHYLRQKYSDHAIYSLQKNQSSIAVNNFNFNIEFIFE
jgi:hypothetical protein